MDEERLFVETEKYQELCDLSHHCITKEMPGEPQLWTLDLEVKPEGSHDTAATGIFGYYSKQQKHVIIIRTKTIKRL